MKPASKIAICQEILGERPFEETCKIIKQIGYEGMELAPFMISKDIRSVYKEQALALLDNARKNQLELVAFHWLLVSPPGMSITSPNPDVHHFTKDFFKHLIQLAGFLGVKILVFGSPKQRNIDPSWDAVDAFKRAVDFFKEMAGECAKHGITIAFEPLGPLVTNLGATFDEAMELITAVDHESFKLHLDVKAMHDDPRSPVEQVLAAGKKLVHFHANDTNLLGPGMGNVDLRPIIDALGKINYDGWISVETFRQDIPPEKIARDSLHYLKSILTSS